MSRKIFVIVIAVALFLHVGALFLLQKMPLNTPSFSTKRIRGEKKLPLQNEEEWAKALFDSIEETKSPTTMELKELKGESIGALSLSFPHLEKEEEYDSLLPPCRTVTYEECFDSSHTPLALSEEEGMLLETKRDLPSGEEKERIAGSDHFDVNVEYCPRRLHLGYLFKVTLIPKQQIAFKRIRENYFFLIDRSNSIIRKRYIYNKKAVYEALSFLHPGDTFNILIFDHRIVSLAKHSLPWNEESLKIARNFLENEGHGGYFAITDLYTSLGNIVPSDVAPNEINTAILLSDGDTYLPIDKQRRLIGEWSAINGGKVSLYCLASGGGNNLSLLEILSTFNKGELHYVSKHDQIRERLNALILSLQHPIGKGLHATAITQDPATTLYLQPKNNRLPDLYKNRPYTLFGYTNRLEDFTLFLQGNYYDKTFDIKKKISFASAKRGTFFLEREWAQLAAAEHYERFFQDGKREHLESAKELLLPLNVVIPFLQ